MFILVLISCSPALLTQTRNSFRQENWEHTKELAEEYVSVDNDSEEGYYYLGRASLELEEYETMNSAFNKAQNCGDKYHEKIMYYREKTFIELSDAGYTALQNEDYKTMRYNWMIAIKVGYSIPQSQIPDIAEKLWLFHFWIGYCWTFIGLELNHSCLDSLPILPYLNLTDEYSIPSSRIDDCYLALQHLDSALAVKPDNIICLELKAYIKFHLSRYNECINLSDHILKLTDYDKNPLLLKSISQDRAGYIDSAIVSYSKLINYLPDNPVILYNLARLYLLRSDYANAIPYLLSSLRKTPTNTEARYMLGECYYKLLEFEKARMEFERVAAIKPDIVNLWEYLAVTYHNLGEYNKEKTALEKIQSMKMPILQSDKTNDTLINSSSEEQSD